LGAWLGLVDGRSRERQEYPQQRPLGGAERRDIGMGLPATAVAGMRTKRSFAATPCSAWTDAESCLSAGPTGVSALRTVQTLSHRRFPGP